MKSVFLGKVLFYIYLAVFAGLSVFFCIFLQQTYREYTTLKHRQEQYTRQVEQAEQELAYKKHYYENLHNNPEFVERVVRQKLGYAKPGEILFRFERED